MGSRATSAGADASSIDGRTDGPSPEAAQAASEAWNLAKTWDRPCVLTTYGCEGATCASFAKYWSKLSFCPRFVAQQQRLMSTSASVGAVPCARCKSSTASAHIPRAMLATPLPHCSSTEPTLLSSPSTGGNWELRS